MRHLELILKVTTLVHYKTFHSYQPLFLVLDLYSFDPPLKASDKFELPLNINNNPIMYEDHSYRYSHKMYFCIDMSIVIISYNKALLPATKERKHLIRNNKSFLQNYLLYLRI